MQGVTAVFTIQEAVRVMAKMPHWRSVASAIRGIRG
jgi:hypothetical protein